jgi:hypothetical protein
MEKVWRRTDPPEGEVFTSHLNARLPKWRCLVCSREDHEVSQVDEGPGTIRARSLDRIAV